MTQQPVSPSPHPLHGSQSGLSTSLRFVTSPIPHQRTTTREGSRREKERERERKRLRDIDSDGDSTNLKADQPSLLMVKLYIYTTYINDAGGVAEPMAGDVVRDDEPPLIAAIDRHRHHFRLTGIH